MNPSAEGTHLQVFNHQLRVWNAHPLVAARISDATKYPLQALLQIGTVNELWKPPGADQGLSQDGWVRLSNFPHNGPGFVPTGLLPIVQEVLRSMGCPYTMNDERVRPDPGLPDFAEIPLRPYQKTAVERCLHVGRGVFVMPPRGGKTRTMMEVVRALWLPTLWIAPTTNIITQTLRAIEELCGKHFAEQLVGSDWQSVMRAHICVCTYATASALPVEFLKTREVVVVDEVHHGASSQLRALLFRCQHIFHRFGMTGTFFRSGTDDLALYALFNAPPLFEITTTELIKLGHLVPSAIAFLPVDAKKVKGATKKWLGGGTGDVGIASHEYRNQLAAWAAAQLHAAGKRVLVLVATKQQGRDIERMIEDYVGAGMRLAEFKRVEAVSTDRPAPVCQRAIDSFASKGSVEILIGTSMIGEGTDLPVADAMVYAPGGKAEVSHTQAFYRVATASSGKTKAIVVDFSDRHNKTLMEHSLARANTYATEPTAQLHALNTVEEFPAWLKWVLSA